MERKTIFHSTVIINGNHAIYVHSTVNVNGKGNPACFLLKLNGKETLYDPVKNSVQLSFQTYRRMHGMPELVITVVSQLF